jgi:tyrosyl-DNA phosphodiesterase 2
MSDVKTSDVKEAGKKIKESVDDSNNLLKKLHQERMARTRAGASGSVAGGSDSQQSKGIVPLSSLSKEQMPAYIEAEGTWLEKPSSELIILTYNVWFREDLELQARMDAIGDIILQHRPHIIFFQLSKLPVVSFKQTPFRNSVMGRELCLAELRAGNGEKLLVATTHLESPCPAPPTWNQMFSAERVVQAKEAMTILRDSPNVIFGGDMNWVDKRDGPPPLPSGWFDAWQQLHPGQVGFTYDSKANLMLTGSRLQERLDQIFCKLRDFEALTIEMVGTAPIPDLTYIKEKKVKGVVQMLKLPVLPSDHFGLLLKVRPKSR